MYDQVEIMRNEKHHVGLIIQKLKYPKIEKRTVYYVKSQNIELT